MNILFIDVSAYKSYDANTLQKEALGGSEASLIRVARGLAKRGHSVSVFQAVDAHREEATIQSVRHVHDSTELNPDIVIHFRAGELVSSFRESYPKARHLIWLQDYIAEETSEGLSGEEVIVLSNAHLDQVLNQLSALTKGAPKRIHKLYNPVEIDGQRYTKIKDRLGFFSSPHKGLEQVLASFKELRAARPELELVVGNPGYVGLAGQAPEGVTFLGELSHPRVMEEMSKCEVLFYPQTVFPETFGIVFAEANAMGVPVLAHDFGSAAEVLRGDAGSPNMYLNCVIDCAGRGIAPHLDRLLVQKEEPRLDSRFEMETVLDSWEALLNEKANVPEQA